jgi:OmcA/MtrC family decaheme c-type cytochrome
MSRATVIAVCWVGFVGVAGAVSIPGGGSKRNDCVVTLQAPGLGFPAGKVFKGATCADGGPCDADGIVNGSCELLVSICLNADTEAHCSTAEVDSMSVSGKLKGGTLDLTALQAAVAALPLPTSDMVCTGVAPVVVPVRGPNKNGLLSAGQAKVRSKAKTSRGTDKDTFRLVCRPSTAVGVTTTTTTEPGSTTTSTSSTSTTQPPPPAGPGLVSEIQNATIDVNGVVSVTFTLTDAAGAPLTPQSASVNPPDSNKARVRFGIARLEVDDETVEGFTTTFTNFENYVLNTNGQPTYDAGGATAFTPAGSPGVWIYTFKTTLPAGYPADLTHRVGEQAQRTYDGEAFVANPTYDFVPAGGPVTTEADVTSTAQCNQCHNPLQAHGGGRREVRLCQICHTNQWTDPSTGFPIDFKNLIHRIHQGKDLPSVMDGAIGTSYGFGNTTFAEKVPACVGGALAGLPCATDADCPSGSCVGATTIGVSFPKDIRACATCHSVTPQSEEADNYKTKPAAIPCTGCHDDVNPSEVPTDAGPPGTNHVAGAQPDAFCRLCHPPVGDEFDTSVPGAHVVPASSQELAGVVATIQGASGTPNGSVTIDFRVTDGAGTPYVSLAGFDRVAFASSGPTVPDFGDSSSPIVQATIVGGGSTGTLTPDGNGNYHYVSAVNLPADATDTWRVGLEMRRAVTLSNGDVVEEAAQNPTALFSVDGSPLQNRRTVVDQSNCSVCHGTFSVDFSIHGNLRNRVDYCVVCHNPNVTDFGRRRSAVGVGADPVDQPIDFKHMIHRIHRGESLEHHPYVIYGFGPPPANFAANDFAEVLFPGDLRDCAKCHVGGSQLLPLDPGLLPTIQTVVDTSGGTALEVKTGSIPPIQDACLTCHDSDDAQAHADTMTTATGAEACNVCHEEGALVSVSEAHAR